MNELRTFKGEDFIAFQGATNLPDGSKPMIANGNEATLVVSGFDDYQGFGIEIIPGEDYDFVEAFKAYDNIERAKADAVLFAQLLDCKLTKEFLSDIGFEII